MIYINTRLAAYAHTHTHESVCEPPVVAPSSAKAPRGVQALSYLSCLSFNEVTFLQRVWSVSSSQAGKEQRAKQSVFLLHLLEH